ncbi:hypothetical protein ABMA32_17070 [Mesorhizobium sp. VNQ89]|uniref:hypothetical protein n=1 Tax=Mesorhizobium quangtriensis TaxID=3157709 RepID=UPI0032B810E8
MLSFLHGGSCSRKMYAVFLAAFIAFDFSKPFLTDIILDTKDVAQDHIFQSDGAKLRQKFEAIEATSTNVARPTGEEERTKALDSTMLQVADLTAGTIAMGAKSSAVGAVFMSLLVALGVVSWLAMIWMLLARLRDIGWPQAVGWGIIAMPVALRVLNPALSDTMWYAVQYSFFALVAALAFVPSNFADSAAAVSQGPSAPKPVSRKQFGLRS